MQVTTQIKQNHLNTSIRKISVWKNYENEQIYIKHSNFIRRCISNLANTEAALIQDPQLLGAFAYGKAGKQNLNKLLAIEI